MESSVPDVALVSYCGLYCGNCRSYKKEKCPGCHGNEKAKWCKVRSCCMENGYISCADCTEFENAADCKKINNFIGKMFAFIFKSDRLGSIALIKEAGYEEFAKRMNEQGTMTIGK